MTTRTSVTHNLQLADRLDFLTRQLAAAEQMKRECFGMHRVDKALDREIHELKRKIKHCKK